MRLRPPCVALAALLLLPCAAFAAKNKKKAAPAAPAGAASLEYVQGRVTFGVKGEMKEGRAGDVLRSGDAVATAAKASAIVLMPDGSRLKLKELTNITLHLPDESGESGATLSLGGVFAKVAKQIAGRRFSIRAGDAVASVRGTRFFTAYGRPAKGGRDLWVCVSEGLVDVGAKGAAQSRPVPAGEGVLIKSGRDLTKPQKYAWTEKLNWNMDPAAGAVEDTVNLDSAYTDLLDQDYR